MFRHSETCVTLFALNANAIKQRTRNCSDELCSDLIGWSFPPVQQAIDDANWQPQRADSSEYCGRCGDSVGPGEATDQGCSMCAEGAEIAGGIGDGVVRLGMYVDPLESWLRAIKYRGWAEMATCLGELLGAQIQFHRAVDPSNTVIVPMPMPLLRRFYRGIDHANVIAQGVTRVLDAPLAKVLSRGNGPPQVSLTPSERQRAGARRMYVRRRLGGWNLRDVDLVLVDDIRTTGASLKAAVRLLRSLKPRSVVCAVLAVSDAQARRARAIQRMRV
jgi:predicted amidophosphoribosyltransferase